MNTPDERREYRHPATHDLRQRLVAVFATHIVEFPLDSDVMLIIPMSGVEQWASLFHLSAKTMPGSARVLGADPEVTLDRVLSLSPVADHALCVNVSRMTRRFLDQYREHGEGLLKELDAISASFKASFPEIEG